MAVGGLERWNGMEQWNHRAMCIIHVSSLNCITSHADNILVIRVWGPCIKVEVESFLTLGACASVTVVVLCVCYQASCSFASPNCGVIRFLMALQYCVDSTENTLPVLASFADADGKLLEFSPSST